MFYEGMKKHYASYQTLCQNIQQTNTLHIGMKTTDFTDFEILESFEKKYPHLSISYSYLEENELMKGLKSASTRCVNFSKYALFLQK